jgi:hypothetical protein
MLLVMSGVNIALTSFELSPLDRAGDSRTDSKTAEFIKVMLTILVL